ncbi:alpha-ribazole phosphatase [Anaerobranca gottschalkii]|uniref:Alpha-ribazole phosphatase n=1 Tax=Anaerobranca gottschalkii DSM 13577 TaxID=1120990 RepID=A0A1I0A1C3_9FIRM|nr:alpha-ribazole phosphatase [Anaerobranca gottschalkii]SES87904.1 alpha-ribazole phosphatase [Anaerobranca gottschalkii DSM 13577]
MKETILYLIRHSESTYNQRKVYYGRIDCPLSEFGVRQSQLLKGKLKKVKFDQVISSPLKRCLHTATIITGLREQEILTVDGFKELDFGLWEGLNFEEIAANYPDNWEDWKRDWKRATPINGENFMEMYNRVTKALTNILQKYQGRKILLVSHKGCLQIIASYLLIQNENLFWNFDFKQGKYSVFEIIDNFCVLKKINC